MANKRVKGENGAPRFVDNGSLASLASAQVQISNLSDIHETYGTRSAWMNVLVDGQTVRSWQGGSAAVLKVTYETTAAGNPRWALLLKITKEEDSDFFEQCLTINKLLKGAVKSTGSLAFAEPRVPFSPVDDGEALLYTARITLDAQNRTPSMVLNKQGKAVSKSFECLRAGQRITIVKFTMPSIYVSTFKPEGKNTEQHNARLTLCVKKIQLQQELNDGVSGKKRKSINLSCADLIEAGSD